MNYSFSMIWNGNGYLSLNGNGNDYLSLNGNVKVDLKVQSLELALVRLLS